MSRVPSTASAPTPTGAPPRATSGRRRTQLTGYSLLARGEPQIWFTGGMLVICLVMIVGLMSYILWAGLPTFWPRPVQWLVLNDGSMEVGQFQTEEPAEKPLDPTAAEGTLATKRQTPPPPLWNRYYRTGNFDLTGQHYRWLSAAELNTSGISLPDWAMVVERLENGRLYGLLGQLSMAADIGPEARQVLAGYQELQELLAALPGMQPELLTNITAAIERLQTASRDQALRAALTTGSPLPGMSQVQTTAGPTWIPASSVPPQPPVVAARRIVTDKADAHRQLQMEIERAHEIRERVEKLRQRISRLDERLSELRAQVRRAELASNTLLAKPIESSHFLLEQYAVVTQRKATIQERAPLLQRLSAAQPWQSAVMEIFNDYIHSGLPAELQAIEDQLAQWQAPIAEQSPLLLAAAQEYQAGYRQIVTDKRPLQREVAELEEQLTLATVSFWVPFAPTSLEAQQRDIQQLLAGKLTPAVQQRLVEQGVTVQPEQLSLNPINDRLTLASTLDQSHQAQLLAIVGGGDGPAGGNGAGANGAGGGGASGTLSTDQQLLMLQSKPVNCAAIVRVVAANQLGWWGKLAVYGDRWREFLLENPREANTEGGVFPAIWGTIVMTLIMTIAVVPFGVMAALYLREYTKSGPLVSIIRISINNLAGVPSIVYGVFGFSFFCYTIGAYVDGGPRNADIQPWPPVLWFMVLGGVSLAGTIAFFLSFTSGGPSHAQTTVKRITARLALLLWLLSVAVLGVLILKSPFFDGFYREYLPNPTFGKGGLLWASLTLSLLTLPVVIVATEEALAAVPNSLREGSLACGASKWQTIYRIVLPHARPGILTGAILAMARGAGEVAPLMLVGALASAPDLPLDGEFPFFHGSRSFMHLGYQIYTLGFQSQNSEAARPMVFTCTLLLIMIVAVLNISAIFLRSRLKQQFQANQF